MKQGKSTRFGELVVGTFVAGVFILLAFFTIVVSGTDLLRRGGQPLSVYFRDVGGLRTHDSVIVRGVPVGQVKDMTLAGGEVRADLTLTQKVNLREGYRIRVMSASPLGGHYLLIEPGDGATLPPDRRLDGQPPHDFLADLADVAVSIKQTLQEGGVLENVRKAAADLADIMARIERGEGTIGRLLAKNDTVYSNLSETVTNLKSATAKLDKGQSSLGKLLNDDGRVYDDVRASVADVRTVASRLEKGEGTLGRLLAKDDALYEDLHTAIANVRLVTDRLQRGEGTLGKLLYDDAAVYTNLAATAANLRQISDRIDRGEGTLGLLTKDDALYKDFRGLVNDARQTVDGMRETTPVTTFSSIILGGL